MSESIQQARWPGPGRCGGGRAWTWLKRWAEGLQGRFYAACFEPAATAEVALACQGFVCPAHPSAAARRRPPAGAWPCRGGGWVGGASGSGRPTAREPQGTEWVSPEPGGLSLAPAQAWPEVSLGGFWGAPHAPNRVGFVGRYGCPQSLRVHQTLEQAQAAFGAAFAIHFRCDLDRLGRAEELLAAAAVGLAAQRGRFEALHRAFFKHQERLSAELIGRLAAGVGIGPESLAHAHEAVIEALALSRTHAKPGLWAGGAPRLSVNGHAYRGGFGLADLFHFIGSQSGLIGVAAGPVSAPQKRPLACSAGTRAGPGANFS